MTTIDMTQPPRPSLRMGEEEFHRWALATEERAEWVNGEVVLKMPISKDHDKIQALIRSVLEHFATRRRIGEVYGPQFTTRMRLASKIVRRNPDVLFVANDGLSRLSDTLLEGPADLAVEIVSPDSDFRDYNQKYLEYEEGGVREYWIINPMSRTVNLFVRDANAARFVRREAGEDGRFRSSVIEGWWFHPDDLFAAERPDAVTLLKRIDPALLE
jgi:Uma2 family endonuclease